MNEKRRLLTDLLTKIKQLKKIYLRKANRYRQLNTISDLIVIGSSTVATTSLIMSLSVIGSPLLTVSLVASSVSTMGSALSKAARIQLKSELFKNAYLGFADLDREIKLTLTKTLTEKEIDIVITDLNDRIGLIIGTTPTVNMSQSGDNGEELTESTQVELRRIYDC